MTGILAPRPVPARHIPRRHGKTDARRLDGMSDAGKDEALSFLTMTEK